MLADRGCCHAVAHRVQAQRDRPAGALQNTVGHGLQAPRDPQSAKAFREVHPGQAGVVAGAEELREGNLLGIVLGDDLMGQLDDPVSGTHTATIPTRPQAC